MRILVKIVLMFFVLQSTWAVAAQYCQHEENPKVEHIGHHTHKHDSKIDDNSLSRTDEQAPSFQKEIE